MRHPGDRLAPGSRRTAEQAGLADGGGQLLQRGQGVGDLQARQAGVGGIFQAILATSQRRRVIVCY